MLLHPLSAPPHRPPLAAPLLRVDSYGTIATSRKASNYLFIPASRRSSAIRSRAEKSGPHDQRYLAQPDKHFVSGRRELRSRARSVLQIGSESGWDAYTRINESDDDFRI